MDFFVEQVIHASPEEVARIMFDPEREGEWVDKAGPAEKLTPGPLTVGSRFQHSAGVNAWKVAFITRVLSFERDRRLEMEITEGRHSGTIVYQLAPTSGGSIASIHVRDDSVARMPPSVWARKEQAKENLHNLARAVQKAHAAAPPA
jgi:hypothetical protein